MMNIKSVLEEQIVKLQALQEDNLKANSGSIKVENAILISEQIRKICVDAEKIAELKAQVSERQEDVVIKIDGNEIAKAFQDRLMLRDDFNCPR